MLRFKNVLLMAALALPLLAVSASSQAVRSATGGGSSSSGTAIGVYVFDHDDARNSEALAEALYKNLTDSRTYTAPTGRGQRDFFRAVDQAQRRADRGNRLLEDRDFCRIGGDNGVQFLAIVDIEKAGRGVSVWARILDLDGCRVVATAEHTQLIRNTAEVNAAASALSRDLLRRQVGRRSTAGAAVAQAAPAPASGGNAMGIYVFDEDDARNAEALADKLLELLIANRRYSAPTGRGQREFFRAVDAAQRRADRRPGSGLLEDRDFCRIGGDNGVQFLTIVDVEKRGRGASIYARILDLDRCRVISSSEFSGLIRNTAEVNAAATALSRELLDTRIRTRSAR